MRYEWSLLLRTRTLHLMRFEPTGGYAVTRCGLRTWQQSMHGGRSEHRRCGNCRRLEDRHEHVRSTRD